MLSCELCRHSEKDYYYIEDEEGRVRTIILTKSDYIRCSKVKAILRNSTSREPARVPKEFANICPFFEHSPSGLKKVIEIECIVCKYCNTTLDFKTVLGSTYVAVCPKCMTKYEFRIKLKK